MKRCFALGLLLTFLSPLVPAVAATLDPALLKSVDSATFEVVVHKAENSPITYARPLPLDQLPFQERNDKYHSIGTAFEISPGHYVTAFHVMQTSIGGLLGPPALRDASGHVFAIDSITRFSLQEDFVEFTLTEQPKASPLQVDRSPSLNTVVYAVGNAMGTGVVIRDGLFTSETPEDQDGRWKWLRFSAAASPGNSGGPLLDAAGKVIGVVLMKSPSENLNYALPISLVLDASTRSSKLDKRLPFALGLTDDVGSGDLRGEIKLPQRYADFAADYEHRVQAFFSAQFKLFLTKNAESLFPHGAGSHELLASKPEVRLFPYMLHQASNGIWQRRAPRPSRQSLADNGYLEVGQNGATILFHLRTPDTVSLKKLYADPKLLMDLLLKAGSLKRRVGDAQISLTSLGKSIEDQPFVDDYQRPWQLHVFAQSYMNVALIVAVLPVPDGYVGMLRPTAAPLRQVTVASTKILANFFNVSYDGSFAAWKAFLSSGVALPPAIARASLDIDYGRRFTFTSPTISLTYTPDLQKIDADGELALLFAFVPDGHQGARWEIGGVVAQPDLNKHDMVRINYHPRPFPELPQGYQSSWKELLQHGYPQNDQPFQRNGMAWVGTVAATAAAGPLAAAPDHIYTVFYGVDGSAPDATMKQKLAVAVKGTVVH